MDQATPALGLLKQSLLTGLLLLSACSAGGPYLGPDNPDQHFNCDMSPYSPACAQRSDYDRHLEMIRTEKQTRRLLRN
ncbi:hypothetical protein SAMN05216185_1062 [Pseudomonas guariconensis]|nr:hypothetical protein SAMN05216185_1062 [Pseudomonas guariconensis]